MTNYVVVDTKNLRSVTFTPDIRGGHLFSLTSFSTKTEANKMCAFANNKDPKTSYIVMSEEEWESVSA